MIVHFLGIGGSGASAVAHIAQSQGFEVTGCDNNPKNEFTKDFRENQLLVGHSPAHLHNHHEPFLSSSNSIGGSIDSRFRGNNKRETIDILAVTPAIFSADPDNEEIKKAKDLGIEVLTWQEFMGKYLEKDKFVLAVCGTHGKSTTTAMLAKVLEEAGLDPTVELGAIVPEWGKNYRVPTLSSSGSTRGSIGSGPNIGSDKRGYFITEADEFNDNFLASNPDITIVLNIEMDHPEFFPSFEKYKDSFYQFFLQTKQAIVANLEDENVAELLKDLMKEKKLSCFDFNKCAINFPLKVIGRHNIKNAQAVFQTSILLGIEPEIIQKALMDFQGIGKRFEKLGQFKGTNFYSDFAHHPTEIKVTVEAIRESFQQQKIWIIFQPHMFSRTKYLFSDFAKVFKELPVEKITITDIYKARQSDRGDVSSEMFVEKVNNKNFNYVPEQELENLVKEKSKDFDLVVFMGAGVIDKIGRKLVDE